jgi:hypothetical protein
VALGSLVMVPLTNPASVEGLVKLAAAVAASDGGSVVPVTVVAPDAPEAIRREAERLVAEGKDVAVRHGADARGLVITHEQVAAGVLDAADAEAATLVLMGWRGRSTHRNVFGELIDTIVGRSRTPMAVVRLGRKRHERVLVPVSDEHLVASGLGGVELAASLARRLGSDGGRDLRLLRTGVGDGDLPGSLAALSDRIHHDPRRYPVAVGAAADATDLVVVPVAPTVSGLRTATTHVAWRAPEATLVVAIDVGPPAGDATEATARVGQPAPPSETESDTSEETVHTVVVVARLQDVVPSSREALGGALRTLGTVGDVEAWEDGDGRRCLRTRVRVAARASNEALAIVMTALHESPGFKGAELRYELEGSLELLLANDGDGD